MESENSLESEPKARKVAFALDFNLGHLFVIFSLFLSAAGLYAHDETRLSIVEERVKTLDSQNLNPRVTTTEVKITALREGMDDIHNVLVDIRNELIASHQENILQVKRVNKKQEAIQHQADQNTKDIKKRIFP